MRSQFFKCDKCGSVHTENNGWAFNRLTEHEVGQDFLADFPELGRLELCDDCYQEFKSIMRDAIDAFLGECNTYPYTEDGDYRGERR